MILWLMNIDFAGGGTAPADEEIAQSRSVMRFVWSRIFGRVN